MTKYLISFPGSAMDISDEDMAAVGEAAHAVIREAYFLHCHELRTGNTPKRLATPVRPSPSLHPPRYSGLRPLPRAGELKRWADPRLIDMDRRTFITSAYMIL